MFDNISVLAGKRAFEIIKENGLDFKKVKFIVGASGAAKFLVLTGFDEAIISLLNDKKDKIHLIGSSIGAFRMAALSQKEPLSALKRL